ncbi:Hypothetical protein R9X50_00144000 [Acrodontium crateriforme]|uniref:alcohol dehydrogenase (NADP(+)) n=1 Tax=Acrodontium crateriforme TaxID=150365 RepID=A0AAQ3RA28_9PEZI|nr:Hypothetical protein R9X50_00144000 [Acrodontium crateriforme]
MSCPPTSFIGWVGHDKSSAKGNLRWESFVPKTWTEEDVDIAIECCGVCGSDIHTLRSGWAPADYPVIVGHEIVGRAVRVGRKAAGGIKVGDRVGVGAQSSACLTAECEDCSNGDEHHCENEGNCNTYDMRYPDGSKATGGYAEHTRVPSHFAFKIPEAISSIEAAPMLCAGITVYAPLVENNAGPGIRVGIVGVGGLGHFGLLWAKALGCTSITAISRTTAKKDDCLKMGATAFIATDEEEDWSTKYAKTVDLIVCTVSSHKMPLNDYLKLLRLRGTFIMVGVPEDSLPAIDLGTLTDRRAKIGGSTVGSRQQIREMLDLAVEKGVHPWINMYPMKDANKALIEFEEGKPRYRFVLKN